MLLGLREAASGASQLRCCHLPSTAEPTDSDPALGRRARSCQHPPKQATLLDAMSQPPHRGPSSPADFDPYPRLAAVQCNSAVQRSAALSRGRPRAMRPAPCPALAGRPCPLRALSSPEPRLAWLCLTAGTAALHSSSSTSRDFTSAKGTTHLYLTFTYFHEFCFPKIRELLSAPSIFYNLFFS